MDSAFSSLEGFLILCDYLLGSIAFILFEFFIMYIFWNYALFIFYIFCLILLYILYKYISILIKIKQKLKKINNAYFRNGTNIIKII